MVHCWGLYLGRQADRLSEFPGNFLAHASRCAVVVDFFLQHCFFCVLIWCCSTFWPKKTNLRHSISMRFATTALSLYILSLGHKFWPKIFVFCWNASFHMIWLRYTSASAHGVPVAPLCEFHGSPDVAALLQRMSKVGSVKLLSCKIWGSPSPPL